MTLNRKIVEKAALSAISFIIKDQNNDGSFYCRSFSSIVPAGRETTYSAILYPSLILSSLSSVKEETLTETKMRLCHFLSKEKSPSGTYNYWPRGTREFAEHYPDDLDDTACALSALTCIDKNLISEENLACFTKVLINSEHCEGGPYYTWILPKIKNTKWADIDLAVNSNIGFFLSRIGISLPNLETLVDEAIAKKSFNSPYYHSRNSIFYFISRFYRGKKIEDLIKIVMQSNLKEYKNPLECALLGAALLNLKTDPKTVERNICYLLSRQKADGSFGSFPFVVERVHKSGRRLSGSKALTTALGLEMIGKYLDYEKASKENVQEDSELKLLQEEILSHCQKLIKNRFDKHLYSQFENFLNKIIASDHDYQISLHPFLFLRSLKRIKGTLKNEFLLNLSTGSILGWIAYTIYDNIMDEQKDIDKLPLANVCSRELEGLYCQDDDSFREIFHAFMDQMDSANFHEIKFARTNSNGKNSEKVYSKPDFVAKKSIAHCLGPLAVLNKFGYKMESPEFKNLVLFYRNYLTARQINDDAHDWEEDLLRGQVNFAGELLLDCFYEKYSRKANIADDLMLLRKIFWEDTILAICTIIHDRIAKARKYLNSRDSLLADDYLSNKLEELEGAADKSLSEREKTINYLNSLFNPATYSKELRNKI